MAFFDTFSNPFDGMNIFGAKAPSYMGGILDANELEKLKQQSLVQGLLGTAATYLAQPKNQRYGSALPYLGKAFLGGMQSSQGVYDQAMKDYMMAQQIKEFKDKEAEKKAWETLKPNLYTTTPAVTQEVTQAGGYAPAQTEVSADQVSPNFGLVKQPDITKQVEVSPAKQELNQAALEKFVLENPTNEQAKAVLQNIKAMKDIAAKERKTITVNGVVLDANTMQPLYTAPQEPIIKTFREGAKDVTKQWNTKTQSWDTLATGEAFKPTTQAEINPDAIKYAASIYRQTGVMPALGQGSSGIRTAILTEAALQNKAEGKTTVEGATDLVSNKASATAIAQLQKQKTMVGAFEKNATKNADIALKLSEQTDRTGVPVFNSWIQAGQKGITGNPTVSAFNAANETFVNEYAKIMSGSMGNTPVSDAARAHAHDMLSTAQTKDQYKAVINVLRQEMGNRMAGFDEELVAAKEGLKGTSKKSESQAGGLSIGQVVNGHKYKGGNPNDKNSWEKI